MQALGSKITVQESPWDCLNFVSMHHEKKPFDDKRVRRALSLALDRYEGSKALSKITLVKDVAGIQVPGTPYATPPAELEKLAGYGHDIAANRAEAKRLLREAGVPDGFSFTFKNRGIPHPYEPVGIWLIDQWRQIGLNVKQEIDRGGRPTTRCSSAATSRSPWTSSAASSSSRTWTFRASSARSDANYGKHKDKVIDELFTSRRGPPTSRSARSTSAPSRSGSSTRRRT